MGVEEIMDVALDIGERMLECGFAVNRVEDTMTRICKSYGMQKVEVFTLNSLSFISATAEDGRTVTKTKRMVRYTTNLHQMELLNELSRYICKNLPERQEIEEKKEALLSEDKSIVWLYLLGYFLGTGAFSMYFNGTIWDGLAAALISMLVFFTNRYLVKKTTNRLVSTMAQTAFVGAMAILLVRLGIGEHVDKVIIGDIMLFIPGISFVNAIRDLLYGDIMTGVFRLVEAIMIAFAIACGISLSLLALGGLLP